MLTRFTWKDSIAAKLLIKVFQYYIFVTIIVTVLHMTMDFSFTKNIIEDNLKVFHTSFEPGLSVALWNQEDEALQASLLAIFHVPQIEGAKIVDDKGTLITAIGNIITESGEVTFYNPDTGLIANTTDSDLTQLFYYEDKVFHVEDSTRYQVGTLVLYSSDSIVFSQVQHGYIFIVINSIIKTIALWLIVIWQSKPLIYKPLKAISDKLTSQDPDKLRQLSFKIDAGENTELSLLKSSLNKLFNMLSLSFEERDKNLRMINLKNDELSQFSYRTSHDLKAPLVTIRGLSNAMVEDINEGDYEEVKGNAIYIGTFVHKLEHLVTDILNLTKADLEVSEKESVDLEEIIGEIKERLKSIYIDTNVEIGVAIDPLANLIVSKARITQVLENLISNSIKYRDNNKHRSFVKISSKKVNNTTLITVEDNGIGIPLKHQHNVFQMFQRFHPNISFGSGLGMYIVKKHLNNMTAEINLESSEKGTIIKIIFLNKRK